MTRAARRAGARKRAALSALLLALSASSAGRGVLAAEPVRARGTPPSLSSLFGVPAAEQLLQSEASLDRRRALLRLSALGSARAVELLAKALDPGGAARGPEEHLTAVRALAPHVALATAREALVRALSSPPAEGDAGPISDWVRASAALALAKSQDTAALSALGRALRKPGLAAALVKDALLAHPPRELTPLLRVPGAATPELCETLGALGDQRAEGPLREIVRRGSPEARAAAALALSALGSTEVLELARHWLRSERQPLLLGAAARILARHGAAEAAPALLQLASHETTRDLAWELALASDGSLAIPSSLAPELASERAAGLLGVFARGLAERWGAAPRLEQALANPETAGLAVYALSRAPGALAEQRLTRALSEPRLRALSLRALVLRSRRLGTDLRSVERLLPELSSSRSAAERAAAAFAQAALDPEQLARMLAGSDAVQLRAVLHLAFEGRASELAVMRLSRERDGALKDALGIGLAEAASAERVPTPVLLELAHAGGPSAPLAARALAARKDAELLPLIRELLTSADPWLRAHAVLGLGRARDADALGMLELAYRFEPVAAVRHAVVVALSRRPEPVRARTLQLAADLDAAADVREAARLALSGQVLRDSAAGSESLWIELPRSGGLAPTALPVALARIGYGLALPLVADPDGLVAVAGVDPAPLELRLALLSERVNGSEEKRR